MDHDQENLKLQCEKLMRDIHNDFMEIFIYESYINEFYRQNDKEGAEVIEEKITDEAQPIPAVNDKEGAEVIKEKIMDATQPIPAVIEQENDITQGEKIEETQEEPRSAPAGKMKRLRRFLRRLFCCFGKQDDN